MRRLLMVIMVLALVAAACGDDDASGAQALADECTLGETDGDLNLYNWTDYIPTGSIAEDAEVVDMLAAFEEDFGVKVVLTEYDSNETMLAQIEAGVGYDVVVPSDYMVSIMRGADLLIKFNPDTVPNLSNIAAEFTELPYDPGNQYSAPYQWGTTGIGYLYGAIDDANGVSWGVIFDPDQADVNTGFISLLDDERETMGAALIYLGYSINTLDEAQVDEAAALISATRG
ncbi:MAG: spermidine/putrescine ABC transporter substrate-binding protein, partial [Gemmatimonadales bacterium]